MLAVLLAAETFAVDVAAQTFDPSGRRRPTRPPTTGRRPPPRPPVGPRKPDPEILIKRYTDILLDKPDAAFPLQKLTELYRERDGNIDKLTADFEARAGATGPKQFNSRIVLAGIYIHGRRHDDAKRLLEEAVTARPNESTPRLMLARLAERAGEQTLQRTQLEAALPLLPSGAEKEQITRKLMVLCIELKDFEAARTHHAALVRAAGGSLFVKREFATEVFQRGHYELAEGEFRKIVTASAGDPRALAPALRDLGSALAKQKKMVEALDVLKRARGVAGGQTGVRAEILYLMTEVFRDQGKLVELIGVLEAEGGRDFQRLATIGGLYEETGQVDKAIATYRAALKLQTRHIDTRVKLVHLLQSAGLLAEAITEYEALIKSAPHNPDFVFELAETLIQRGDRAKALDKLKELERRSANEGPILATVADFYERIEEKERSIKVLERVAKLPSSDPQYLIDLGDRYFQAEDKKRALATWEKIRTVVRNRAKASSILGEVYLEHDLPDEALTALREAVKLAPTQHRYEKQLAIALERTANDRRSTRHRRYAEALTIWEKLLDQADQDAVLSREARTHIVSLWAILRQLPDKVAPLAAKLNSTPPDLQAGRLLAEVQRRLHRLADSESTLRKVSELAPGDHTTLLALERVLVMQRKLPQAIEVLEKLAEADVKSARQYYQRMAQYAAEMYRDDDAIKYAARAVELSPDDAVGHYRLGKMYRRRQDTKHAVAEYRQAIKKNDRMFRAYFDLAELLLAQGDVGEADRLYRFVIRSSRDEQFVMRAARASMQINLGKGTLESLERELLPVTLGNPQKPVYRRLLVEVYGALTFPLVHAARFGTAEQRTEARQQLATIGARAVKPLLDALTDKNPSQQRIAIEVLAYVQNRGAGPALFNYATGQAERELRVRAMVACGALDDPELLPRYKKLLLPDGDSQFSVMPGDAVAVAATWGVARIRDRKAEALLLELVRSPSPEVRALAAIGLGMSGDRNHTKVLADLARSPLSGPLARAAAAHALGNLGADDQSALLLGLTDSAELDVKQAALLALARLQANGKAASAKEDIAAVVSRSLLSEQPELRRAATAAAAAMTTADYRRDSEALSVPDGVIAVGDVLDDLAPKGYSNAERAHALAELKTPLAQASVAAVATSPDRSRVVAELTMTNLAPLLAMTGQALPDDAQSALRETAQAIAEASTPGFVALAGHPSVEVRKRALEFLARQSGAASEAAVIAALSDRDPAVVRTTLSTLGRVESQHLNGPDAVKAVIALLDAKVAWSTRSRAAEALGRLAQGQPEVVRALATSALEDEFALVREAAIRALLSQKSSEARAALAKVAEQDREARLRELAGRGK